MGVTLTKEMINGAMETQQLTGVPASVTLGQIMLESGGSNPGGLSGLAYKYNNLFGIKASKANKWQASTVNMNNKAGTDPATYAVFNSVADAIKEHARIVSLDRYKKHVTNGDYKDWANALRLGGYGGDEKYTQTLISIIEKNGLTKYDDPQAVIGQDILNATGTGVTGFFSSWFSDLLESITVFVFCVMLVIFGLLFLTGAFGVEPEKIVKDKVKEAVGKGS